MILSFKTQMDGKPTHFKEKILSGRFPEGVYREAGFVPKFHSIRVDLGNRWHAGQQIHFATGVRTKRYECFLQGVCVSTQHIAITSSTLTREVYVDGRRLNDAEIFSLARLDGFDTPDAFFAWFSGRFLGKIIHWTHKRY